MTPPPIITATQTIQPAATIPESTTTPAKPISIPTPKVAVVKVETATPPITPPKLFTTPNGTVVTQDGTIVYSPPQPQVVYQTIYVPAPTPPQCVPHPKLTFLVTRVVGTSNLWNPTRDVIEAHYTTGCPFERTTKWELTGALNNSYGMLHLAGGDLAELWLHTPEQLVFDYNKSIGESGSGIRLDSQKTALYKFSIDGMSKNETSGP